MDEGPRTGRRETSAREWLLVLAVGVVIAVAGPAMGMPAAAGVGVVVGLVGLFGLVWRLLAGR